MNSGGSVFFAHKPEAGDAFHLIYRNIGIYEVGQSYLNEGIQMHSNVLLHSKGLKIEEDLISNLTLMLRMDEKNLIHATTLEDVPLLWERDYGEGKIMIFNGTMLQWQANRGFLVGALSLLTEDFIYPVMNIKLAFIDRFPGPLPNNFNQQIYDKYGVTLDTFYRNIWWQDLLNGMKEYDLKYTGAFLVSFDKKNEIEMFEPAQLRAPLVLYGRELLNNGGEIGLNGYSNDPFVTDGGWSNEGMAQSLADAHAVLKQVFPRYEFHTYVPPENRLDQMGLKVIQEALPQVNIISSIYQEKVQESNQEKSQENMKESSQEVIQKSSQENTQQYGQEFVIREGMVDIPRMTFGYDWTPAMQWNIGNGITSLGVFSHAISPPYTFDQKHSWQSQADSYNTMLRVLKDKFGWLRSMTATEAANELVAFERATVSIHRNSNQMDVQVEGSPKDQDVYFMYRTKESLTSCQGCSYQIIDDGIYLIQAKEKTIQMNWGEELR
jgi:hypothetical protein